MKFTPADCRLIGQMARDILNSSEEFKTMGLTFADAGGQYAVDSFTMRLKATNADPTVAGDVERDVFASCVHLFGLVPADYGCMFTSAGHSYRLVEIKPGSAKFPLIGVRDDGKRFKFTPSILPQIKSRREANPRPIEQSANFPGNPIFGSAGPNSGRKSI